MPPKTHVHSHLQPQLLLIDTLALYTHVHILHRVPESILLNPHHLSECTLDPVYTQLLHTPLHTHILVVGS